jgi:hypothetical protein
MATWVETVEEYGRDGCDGFTPLFFRNRDGIAIWLEFGVCGASTYIGAWEHRAHLSVPRVLILAWSIILHRRPGEQIPTNGTYPERKEGLVYKHILLRVTFYRLEVDRVVHYNPCIESATRVWSGPHMLHFNIMVLISSFEDNTGYGILTMR